MEIYIFRTNGVSAQIRSHQNTEAVFAHDRLIEDFRLNFGLFTFGVDIKCGWLIRLVVFDLLLLCSDRLQVHELCLQQKQNRLGWLRLSQLIQNLEQQKKTLYLQEKFKLVQVLKDNSQVTQTEA